MTMLRPVTRHMRVARNEPFGRMWNFTSGGEKLDLTGYTALWQWRLYEGAPGPALLSIETVDADVEGLRFVLADAGDAYVSALQAIVDRDTLAGLPVPLPPAEASRPDNLLLSHDLILIDPEGYRQRLIAGVITLHSGVTH